MIDTKLGWVLVGVVGFVACSGASGDAPNAHVERDEDASAAAPTTEAGADDGRATVDAAPAKDASVSADPTGGKRFDADGPVPYTSKVETVTRGNGSTFDVTIYMPSSPGPHPVVSFSCGSTQTAAAYVPYGKRLASYGIAMILRDDPGALTATADIVPDAEWVVATWMPQAHAADLDASHVGLAGHSRGGAVSLIAAERGLKGKVAAWFGLDPVDNQFLLSPGLYARTGVSQLGIPTAYLGAEITSNCAPAADNYRMLFPKAASPSLLIEGKGAGHTQLGVQSACTGCALCSPSGTQPADVVLAYAVRYFTAFFVRELAGDATVGTKLEAAGSGADVAAGLITITTK